MNRHAQILSLDDYRGLVSLDQEYTPPQRAKVDIISTLVSQAALALSKERGVSLSLEEREPRAVLQALLTMRGPAPMPEDLLSALEQILRHEREEKTLVDAMNIPRIGEVGHFGANVALWQGDITTLTVDAIVNAANSELLGCFHPFHKCIDNAIHSAAGPRLREDCARIMRQQGGAEPVGHAKATRAYLLPSRFVLHTVGPQVRGPLQESHKESLARCYRACLDKAARLKGVKSVAFCSISTGVFGFPREPAARIALQTVEQWMDAHPGALDLVVFNVFTDADRNVYETAIREKETNQ